MNDRETLDAIHNIVDAHVRNAREYKTDPDPELAEIGRLILECKKARQSNPSDRDVLLDAADALRNAGNDLFKTNGAPPRSTRRAWQAEDRLRDHFGLPNPDAGVASAPEKKE